MDDLGDKISAILNDPGQLERITGIAKSIMGGESPRETDAPLPDGGDGGFDPAMLGRLSELMRRSGEKSDKRMLLEAMKPYLSEKRRKKMDRALRLAKLASFAEIALKEFREDDDDV